MQGLFTVNLDWSGEWSSNPEIFSTRTFVRSRRPWNSWVSWNSRLGGGPTLVVKQHSFEVSAPQGWIGDSRELIMKSPSAIMSFDRVGWAGTPFDRKNCIHVAAEDQTGRRIELALTPEAGLQDAWDALVKSGVQMR